NEYWIPPAMSEYWRPCAIGQVSAGWPDDNQKSAPDKAAADPRNGAGATDMRSRIRDLHLFLSGWRGQVMQHENYALVTGGGSGIGRAVALALAGKDLSVIITGRRQQPLDETRREDPERIRAVSADISTDEGRAQLC